MLSFFGFGKKNIQKSQLKEEMNGVIGKYYENDFPVIMKFINELPDRKITSKLTILSIISWNYDGIGNNGMPSNEVNKSMIFLEDAVEASVKETDEFIHVYSRTGNNLKEFAYYSKSQKGFMKLLNKTLKTHKVYPIEISFFDDKEWSDFKNVISKFN